jgi:carbon monoxide dehydrogenase subunit G
MTMIELETQKRIAEVVQFLKQPEFNASVWPVIQTVEKNLEKRLGLNELSYGSSDKQIRSAAEADIKSQGVSIRPDDMAECVEAWMAEAARKEA